MLNRITSYFKSCYEADFRSVSLLNFFGKKAESPLILEDVRLFRGLEMECPISIEWGTEVLKKLKVYSKEKELYCGAFFLFGSTNVIGRKVNLGTPLFLFPAQLSKELEFYYLKISHDQMIINPAIFQILGKEQSAVEKFKQSLPHGYFKENDEKVIEKAFKEFAPEVDTTHLENFPYLYSEKFVKAFRKSNQKKGAFEIAPIAAAFVMDKSKGSVGVINELEEIARSNSYSKPMREIFENHNAHFSKLDEILSVPVILSQSQKAVLQSANAYNLSLVIGPPGTGKSFTIAALAVEFMTEGKSVLIASKNNQAGKVIADKIEKDFGLEGIPIRAGKSDYKTLLQKRLENWLSGIGLEYGDHREAKSIWEAISEKMEVIEKEEKTIEELSQKEEGRGEFLADYRGSLFQRIKMYFLENEIKKEAPLWEIVFDLERDLESRNELFRKHIKLSFKRFLNQALYASRREIQSLLTALRARTGSKKEEVFNGIQFSKILKALPIWITCSTDIHKVLPLEEELFDLVIIDEATQCDIASSLPLLYRAKKAVIVGDPKQLRHLSFVSGQQLRNFQAKHQLQNVDSSKLDYRNKSILDLVSESIGNQKQVQFLNEHFRSMPDIIEFSNQKFYDGKLNIMTAQPKTLTRQHAFLKRINGKRTKAGYNKIEAEEIINFLKYFFENESEKSGNPLTVGIVSPFADQANYLQALVLKSFSTEALEKHDFLVGTPFSFQGEEKDIMLISLTLDDDSHPSAFNYFNREDMFNVTITRARTVQYVYTSFDFKRLKSNNLAAQYLHRLENFKSVEKSQNIENQRDIFMQDVMETIQKIKPDEVLVSFPIAGVEIDLVVLKDKKTYCIDLIGHPGDFTDALTLERWRMLERVGLRTFFLPFSQWYFDRRKCQKALLDFLETEMLLVG